MRRAAPADPPPPVEDFAADPTPLVQTLPETATSQLLGDYRDRYKDEWSRRDRIMRELQLLLVIAGLEVPAFVAFVKHAGALLVQPLAWTTPFFLLALLAALVPYSIGTTAAMRVLLCASPYRFLVKPEEELKYLDRLRRALGAREDGAGSVLAEFTAWRVAVYAGDATRNASVNGMLNDRLHLAKRWIVFSLPAACAAGILYLLG